MKNNKAGLWIRGVRDERAHSWTEKAEVEKLRSLEVRRVYARFSLNFSISQFLFSRLSRGGDVSPGRKP
jgi:hypothetical protein